MTTKTFIWNTFICPLIEITVGVAIVLCYFGLIGLIFQVLGI